MTLVSLSTALTYNQEHNDVAVYISASPSYGSGKRSIEVAIMCDLCVLTSNSNDVIILQSRNI